MQADAGKEWAILDYAPGGPRGKTAKYGGRFDVVDRFVVFERDGWICQLCGGPVDPELKRPDVMSASLDHVVPLSLGGDHSMENSQLAHLSCNSAKGSRV
ncbi:HNH endonuclease [Actinomycetaceae bacterium WB03_NA08]|uniref:HNH endonuclease n=1 Tax=Scrofimicrobium canadense TaxID=2652290 RepID=A0A6N7W5A8_9ACTO|nr:HNH endonuclease signature motif containing protein [Scrofimicrobium canadense]MSS84495.1 HNH endonuclease [Scrofimicrobium canadense]